ncbi:SANT and BTB domain regulator of class switch recombination-like isoform X1 [Mytilus californianus]|uniref:SANT and BTB domain regulator of class switch recombination-like isoform X1 n=1 Tax=Mytilus californianus TaxID=6549 RepID=UPI00224510CD|nr:SANT and BTB domain regulator of class switch recombination-like isoform X1 [Mytilus californianus]XP_052074716.1 SANT and BTB domain regulator of class switch recombination-like isoform X1 [Mytilus californianus]
MKMNVLEPTSRVGVALDLILNTLISSQDFNELQTKNWEAIARLIPGSSPGQVARRYEELLLTGDVYAMNQFEKNYTIPGASSQVSLTESDLSSKTGGSCPGSASQKGDKDSKDTNDSKSKQSGRNSDDQGPVMTIHVCDEAKSLKQDFHCPRDLLVQEMKYFAEYLSTDAQRWEEVDISVHCDVQIFDWLMKYVKRGSKDVPEKPRLEASNVISILISSDFLKMDSLVQECIEYCHGNMSAIVSTPCNMNCINEKLVGRIADLFTHNEADDIKDRKDKFKSKLFAKKLEKLFDANSTNPDSPECAATLMRCSVCKKVMGGSLEKKLKCTPSRLTVDRRGTLTFCHIRDPSFDVNEYLLELKGQLKTWREVYWRVWGTINYLICTRCKEVFPCSDLGHCKYHPEPARYDNEGSLYSCIGTYPCCHQRVLRFDPTQQNKGCRVRDHIVTVSDLPTEGDKPPQNGVYDDLLSHRDVICVPYQRLSDASEMEFKLFDNEEFVCYSHKDGTAIHPALLAAVDDDKKPEAGKPQPRLQALTMERELSFEYDDVGLGESDDEVGDDEQPRGTARRSRGIKKSMVTIDPQAILMDAPEFEQTKKSTWDTGRSMRYNQDAQRQEDQRRMKEIRVYLTKLRLNPEKIDKPKKEFLGGQFCKIESQWRANNLQNGNKPGIGTFRGRPIVGGVRREKSHMY